MNISSRLNKLKNLIKDEKIDGYLIPKNDEFFSEEDSSNRLSYISNFDGSSGLAVVFKKRNYLFVDGRYTLQAKKQTNGLFKVYEIPQNLPHKILNKKMILGYDPNIFTEKYINIFFGKKFNLKSINKNLVDLVSKRIDNKKYRNFYYLDKKIVGENETTKVRRVTKAIKVVNADFLFVSAPENVAWLLNIRGYDSKYSPLPKARVLLTKNEKIYFFSDPYKVKNIKKKLSANSINFYSFNEFDRILKNIPKGNFIIDAKSCSIFNRKMITKKFKINSIEDPIYKMKSTKNKIEISNMIKSHIYDGIALTKFLFWIENYKQKISELDVEKKLSKLRKKNKNYLFPSFNTIAGSGPNGAIIHYRATKKTNRVLKKNEILLCDSGGQYKYGTTDVTRTICLGKPNNLIKNIFTKVLKGHIAVVCSNLNKIKNGKQLDKKAREFLKKDGLNYQHGTGHGVGFFLNVHEGPQSISRFNKIKFDKGMILSNEPGYYKKGSFGIRIENLIYINGSEKNLHFENLTLAPIDKNLINFKLLTNKEKDYLFRYHLNVYSKLSPFLENKERKWLASLI